MPDVRIDRRTFMATVAGAALSVPGSVHALERPSLRPRLVALRVSDIDRVSSFYREVVGLDVLDVDVSTTTLGVDGRGLIRLHREPALVRAPDGSAGLYHTAFLLPSRGDLGAWLSEPNNRSSIEGASDHLVSEALYLSDPEGNGVEIYSDRDQASWRWENGSVLMGSRSFDLDGVLTASRGRRWTGAPAGTKVGHVHLQVGDVARSREFYADALGMDVVRERDGAVFMSTGAYHHHVAVNVWRSAGASVRSTFARGLAYVEMETDDSGGVGPTLSRMTRAGFRCTIESGRVTATDPWGNVLKVFEVART